MRIGVLRPGIALSAVAGLWLWAEILALAAPLPPFRPVDLCGRVRHVSWLPPLTLPGDPGVSGSAAHTRSWPGRFAVVLDQVTGAGAGSIGMINALLTTSADGAGIRLAAGEVLVILPHEDPVHLADAAAICVAGFSISGDEGGTWTRYDGLWITARKSK
jgi:hypothetical protein